MPWALPFAGPAVYPIAAPSLYHLKEFMATYIAYAIALAFPLLLICVFIHDGITSKRRQQEELLARAIEKAFTNAARKRRAELLKHNEKP
jgi:hypothetical protein